MRHWLAAGILAPAVLVAASSDAAVVYRFEAASLAGLTSVEGSAIFDDGAFALGGAQPFVDTFGADYDGLVSFVLTFGAPGGYAYEFNAGPSLGNALFRSHIQGGFGLGEDFLTGSFHAGGSSTEQADGTTAGNIWALGFGTDDPSVICFGGVGERCTATGIWRRVEVTEPASTAVFLLAVAGGLMATRRSGTGGAP